MTASIHDQKYEFYSWEELGQDIFSFSKEILEKDIKIDRVVALAKGGITFARSLIDYLGVENLSTLQIEFYTNINQRADAPIITQELPISVEGENVLIFDDIVDTGETLKFATEYLTDKGAKKLYSATIVQKPWAEPKADFVMKSTDAWVIFPNEVRETIDLLKESWAKKGDSPEEIQANLLKIGFSKAEVELFLNLK